MRGSVNYQCNQIYVQSGIFQPGSSKHEAKNDALSKVDKGTPDNVAQHTGIYSDKYDKEVKNTFHELGHHARQEHKLRDMTKLDEKHVRSYLEQKIQSPTVNKYGSFSKIASHVGKIGKILESYDGQPRDFQAAAQSEREIAKDVLDRSTPDSRGFENPQSVVDRLPGDYNLVGKLQLEGGLRREEASTVHSGQLKGLVKDPVTGQQRGKVDVDNPKGGKPREVHVSSRTYQELSQRLEKGPIKVTQGTYGTKVAQAAREAGETCSGSHDFRYNFGASRFNECIEKGGLNNEQALQQTSWEMGHERANMTLYYLR